MTCPICQRDTDPKYRPFCSRRCADVDLGRWMTGSYRIPAESLAEPDEGSSDADRVPPPQRPH